MQAELTEEIVEEYGSMPLEDEATRLAEYLSKKFGVDVWPIDTDEQYYSNETLLRTARESVYFVSREDTLGTARCTKHMLKLFRLKYDLANANRIENANQKSSELRHEIEQLKSHYREAHPGKEPSLNKIANILNEKKILSPGDTYNWTATTVKRILGKGDRELK